MKREDFTGPVDREAENFRRLPVRLRDLASSGRLPTRYTRPWDDVFCAALEAALQPSTTIVDLGSGARPTIPADCRPVGCRYIGVDISRVELERAPTGSYSAVCAVDVSSPGACLMERADVVVSWQVLEHVSSMSASLENIYRWLTPGGQLVALLSGSWALSSLVSRIVPHKLRTAMMRHLYGSPAEDKFPTVYDQCRDSSLRELLAPGWTSFEITPRYRGASYVAFSEMLTRGYLCYENYVERHGYANFATHYVVHATK
jgi:SAM-dependent methyltransferase